MPNKNTEFPPAVKIEDLTIEYDIIANLPNTIERLITLALRRELRTSKIKALDKITFEIGRGEIVGIVGNNGAGKSTLLKAISQIIYPTSGRIRVWGNVVALLGLGVGFHNEFLGRENLFLYSAILGRSRQRTEELYDEIVEFAELEDFIDAPLRVYSRGMAARLGFAVAMAERPEILIIDEVFSVGDANFRGKCLLRFDDFCDAGSTILIVSHNLLFIKDICNRVLQLEKGRIIRDGEDVEKIIAEYSQRRRGS